MAAAMNKIPVRFRRVAAAFDEEVARVRLCESSGSEHSAAVDSVADLSDLVKSFIERQGGDDIDNIEMLDHEKEGVLIDDDHEELEGYWSDSETKKSIQNLLLDNKSDVKQKIVAEVEVALSAIGDRSSRGFKRSLITHLRGNGFDAGLCKSKWVKSSRFPAGDYEFIDVNVEGSRYIVEAFFVGEFEIARPTPKYTALLGVLPRIFVGEVEELKKIVRLMCTAIKKSMKSMDMPVPPWRRNGYMQAKWFGPYKRTTNAKPAKAQAQALELNSGSGSGSGFGGKRSLGFEFELKALPTKSYYCRDDFATKNGYLRVGHLTAAFQGSTISMELQ